MAEYMDDPVNDEELRALEDEGAHEPAPTSVSTRELPNPLFRIKSSHSNETYYAFWQGPETLEARMWVVAPTRYGKDICELQGLVQEAVRVSPDELVKIDRLATPEDLERKEANKEREQKAYELCKQKIESRHLPMKLVSAHYLPRRAEGSLFFQRRFPCRFSRAREGSRLRIQDADRTQADRRPRRGSGYGRLRRLRAGSLLPRCLG